MKLHRSFRYLSFAIVTAILIAGCSVHTSSTGKIPPGQAKKIAGSKSAKPYAPGQRKKQ